MEVGAPINFGSGELRCIVLRGTDPLLVHFKFEGTDAVCEFCITIWELAFLHETRALESLEPRFSTMSSVYASNPRHLQLEVLEGTFRLTCSNIPDTFSFTMPLAILPALLEKSREVMQFYFASTFMAEPAAAEADNLIAHETGFLSYHVFWESDLCRHGICFYNTDTHLLFELSFCELIQLYEYLKYNRNDITIMSSNIGHFRHFSTQRSGDTLQMTCLSYLVCWNLLIAACDLPRLKTVIERRLRNMRETPFGF